MIGAATEEVAFEVDSGGSDTAVFVRSLTQGNKLRVSQDQLHEAI